MRQSFSAGTSKPDESTVEKGVESFEWKGSADEHGSERIFYLHKEKGRVLNISTPSQLTNPRCYVFLDPSPHLHVISFEWLPLKNSSFTVLVRVLESNVLVLLNIVPGNDS
ncbi:hypothetical protein Q1695_006261 [Nippostrongylus brasiliensis]|nr:hypothetical protein Q1695_006261 [Nippostrongylus brasiliensis]